MDVSTQVNCMVGYVQLSMSEIDKKIEEGSYSKAELAQYRASSYMRVILTLTQKLDELKTTYERDRTD